MDGQDIAPPPYEEAVAPPQGYQTSFVPQPFNVDQLMKDNLDPPQGFTHMPQGGTTVPHQGGAFAPPGGTYANEPQGGPYHNEGGAYQPQVAGEYAPQGFSVNQLGYPHQVNQSIERSVGYTQPPDYMVFAFLVTFFCCLPMGILAIVNAMEAKNRWQMGDTTGAQQSALNARRWCLMGLVFGLILEIALITAIIVLL